MNDEERVRSISAWICNERETKSVMPSPLRPKGCESFVWTFRCCVRRVLASNTLRPRSSLPANSSATRATVVFQQTPCLAKTILFRQKRYGG